MIGHVLYLDTNHISDIARNPTAAEARAALRILQTDRARLAITLLHFIELTSLDFVSFPAVRDMLRDVPVAWTLSTEEVWDSEIAVACARARGNTRLPPRVFCETALDWSRGPSPASGDAAEYLDVMVEQSGLRRDLLDVAAEAARVSMMKTEAAVVKDPDLPLRLSVRGHLKSFRSRLPDYAGELGPDEVIRLAGGPTAFPSFHLFHSTVKQRLSLVHQKSTHKDVFDEYHAAYAPYAAATALDRGTAARVRSARLADRHRVTARLADVPALLDRVEAGLLVPAASTL